MFASARASSFTTLRLLGTRRRQSSTGGSRAWSRSCASMSACALGNCCLLQTARCVPSTRMCASVPTHQVLHHAPATAMLHGCSCTPDRRGSMRARFDTCRALPRSLGHWTTWSWGAAARVASWSRPVQARVAALLAYFQGWSQQVGPHFAAGSLLHAASKTSSLPAGGAV
jgi:hypothetical protein